MNEERITQGYRQFKPGRDFLRTPIFLSSGVSEVIATLEQQNAVEDSMRRTGFENIRHTTFPGGTRCRPASCRKRSAGSEKGCSQCRLAGSLKIFANLCRQTSYLTVWGD
jgi:hypothetical protein